jgi:hypothetical protein
MPRMIPPLAYLDVGATKVEEGWVGKKDDAN